MLLSLILVVNLVFSLFPNAFQGDSVQAPPAVATTQINGAQIQVENVKIGPPLEEALKELVLAS
ncbi:MAG TPA: hypothetical protein VGO47_04200 [Chlamydiales bacterium]|nr:hypothetical protein [Chlamydiales bacterium]